MPRLLVDPLGEVVRLAIAQANDILAVTEGHGPDKPVALEQAFKALSHTKFDEIVLVNGPGNFTSLRVAVGFVRALALGWNIPSRGIGVFDIDLAVMPQTPTKIRLYRDARGGRYYEAHVENHQITSITLTQSIEPEGHSAENLDGTHLINATPQERLEAVAKLAEEKHGQTPARAFYVRPPDATLPSAPPLVILDE